MARFQPTFALAIPDEPGDTAVVADDAGTAYQRYGGRWYAARPQVLRLAPIQAQGWEWAELLLRRGQIRLLAPAVAAGEKAAAEQRKATEAFEAAKGKPTTVIEIDATMDKIRFAFRSAFLGGAR